MKKDIRAYGYDRLKEEMEALGGKNHSVQSRFMNGFM